MFSLNCGMICGHSRHRPAPDLRRGQHIGLIDRSEPPGTRFRACEGVLGYALDLRGSVDGFIAGALTARIGLHAVLTEINVAGKFADEVDVHVLCEVLPQWRQAAKRCAQINWPEVDVQAEFLTQREQSAFRALADGLSIPIRPAHG